MRQSGFSLLELLVVVAIIATLSAAAMPLYSGYSQRAKVTSAIASLRQIQLDIALCIQQQGSVAACANNDNSVLPVLNPPYPEHISDLQLLSQQAILQATLTISDREQRQLRVQLIPQLSRYSIDWQIRCSDFDAQQQPPSLVENCHATTLR
ncbi:pilin [Idiomarina xiamenensis]|uniref:Pilin protein PilA n=1 Tax=Idiomarina xiamenensis 10-D-4 TaxID=740709 RepID=K2KF11_9GAMM|nr:prepilin-type N-terminal cleavage/methylation domain-containing protein [Idiomarina xiamenensis]EKE85317.1 pilin protein PilA [Idiomarina xiamenensis 10-D-4]